MDDRFPVVSKPLSAIVYSVSSMFKIYKMGCPRTPSKKIQFALAPSTLSSVKLIFLLARAAQSVTLDVVGVFPGDAPGSFLLQTSVQVLHLQRNERTNVP